MTDGVRVSDTHREALGNELCQLFVGALVHGSHQKLVLHILPKPGLRVLCMPSGLVTDMLVKPQGNVDSRNYANDMRAESTLQTICVEFEQR